MDCGEPKLMTLDEMIKDFNELYEQKSRLDLKVVKLRAQCKNYKKILKKISRHCKEQNLKYDLLACEILSMIEEIL